MPVVVPEEDGRLVQGVLVAENAKRCGAEPEVTRVARRQAQPACGQDAEEVAVTEEDDSAAACFEPSHDAVRPGATSAPTRPRGNHRGRGTSPAAPRGSRP